MRPPCLRIWSAYTSAEGNFREKVITLGQARAAAQMRSALSLSRFTQAAAACRKMSSLEFR